MEETKKFEDFFNSENNLAINEKFDNDILKNKVIESFEVTSIIKDPEFNFKFKDGTSWTISVKGKVNYTLGEIKKPRTKKSFL